MRDEFLTVEELAERYRTTPATVYGWIHKKTAPPSIRVGRRRLFPLRDLVVFERERVTNQRPRGRTKKESQPPQNPLTGPVPSGMTNTAPAPVEHGATSHMRQFPAKSTGTP